MRQRLLAPTFAISLFVTALAIPFLGSGGTALACHEHQLVTPGTTVENIARGQTSKALGEGGYHAWHSNVHTAVPGSKIGNDKGAAGLPNNPVTITGNPLCVTP